MKILEIWLVVKEKIFQPCTPLCSQFKGYASISDATKKQIDCYGRHSWHAYHFLTHSIVDPELARLFATEYDGSYSQATALIRTLLWQTGFL